MATAGFIRIKKRLTFDVETVAKAFVLWSVIEFHVFRAVIGIANKETLVVEISLIRRLTKSTPTNEKVLGKLIHLNIRYLGGLAAKMGLTYTWQEKVFWLRKSSNLAAHLRTSRLIC